MVALVLLLTAEPQVGPTWTSAAALSPHLGVRVPQRVRLGTLAAQQLFVVLQGRGHMVAVVLLLTAEPQVGPTWTSAAALSPHLGVRVPQRVWLGTLAARQLFVALMQSGRMAGPV